MSAQRFETPTELHEEPYDDAPVPETEDAPTPVVVRRRAGLAALLGAGASAVAIAYLWRASQSGAVLDWALCGVMALTAGYYLSLLVDARTPLVVADDLGVRIRLGNQWRGLPWASVRQVVVRPGRGPLRDGRLIFAPHHAARALEGLDPRGRRQAVQNEKAYGAALAVPIGLTTRITAADPADLVDRLVALTRGEVEVLTLVPERADERPERSGSRKAEERPTSDLEDVDHDGTARTRLPAGGIDHADPAAAVAAADLAPTDAAAADLAAEPAVVEPAVVDPAVVDPAVVDPAVVDPAYVAAAAEDVARVGDPDDLSAPARTGGRSLLGGLGTIVSRFAKGRSKDVDGDAPTDIEDGSSGESHAPAEELSPEPGSDQSHAVPLRTARPALRAEISRGAPATQLANVALHPTGDPTGDPTGPFREARELRRPGSVDLVFEPVPGNVRPISLQGDAVAPLVIDDFQPEPAYDPVIGPELAAARNRLGLSVDDLAERTRIRPHVIESIEVDDFAPCGGDFYARGHLRTLARVLGKDVEPMLAAFEARYATAPVNARRVFEAELATGMTGSMRSTVGGQHWGLLIGVVLSLVLVWGVVRLFATEPAEVLQTPGVVLNGSAGVDNTFGGGAVQPKPLRLTLTATGPSRVVVRDGEGEVAYTEQMVAGQRAALRVPPPVRVRASDAGAVEVRVRGTDRGPVGEAGEPGRRTFRDPAGR